MNREYLRSFVNKKKMMRRQTIEMKNTSVNSDSTEFYTTSEMFLKCLQCHYCHRIFSATIAEIVSFSSFNSRVLSTRMTPISDEQFAHFEYRCQLLEGLPSHRLKMTGRIPKP